MRPNRNLSRPMEAETIEKNEINPSKKWSRGSVFSIIVVILLFVAACDKDNNNGNNNGNGNDPGGEQTIHVISVKIDSVMTLDIGQKKTLIATIDPSNATNKEVTWSSNNPTKAEISDKGEVFAKAAGNTIVTVITKDGNKTATCKVTVNAPDPFYDKGVVINGVKWATRNVAAPGKFADDPQDIGMFYQWNSNIGWSSSDPMENTNGGTEWNSSWNGGGNSITTWQTTRNVCPTGWRLPTKTELANLVNAGSSVESPGRVFGSGDNTIFLRAGGLRNASDGNRVYEGGRYWSSTSIGFGATYALSFSIYSNDVSTNNNYTRSFGFCVRCVAE